MNPPEQLWKLKRYRNKLFWKTKSVVDTKLEEGVNH